MQAVLKYFKLLLKKLAKELQKLYQELWQQPIKTAAVFIIIIVIFFLFSDKLTALLIASIVPMVVFRWDARVYFVLALFFLACIPFFIITKQEYWAEQLAIYTYYLLSIGVLIQIVEYIRISREKDKAIKEDIKKFIRLNISGLTLCLVIVLFLVGFYYLNNKFTNQLSEQKKLLLRMGGYKIEEQDTELVKLKKQLKELIDLYSQTTYSKQNSGNSTLESTNNNQISTTTVSAAASFQDIAVTVLNGTNITGLAGKLAKQLQTEGFKISKVGNAAGNYVTTTIFYASGYQSQAKSVAKEVEHYYITQLKKSSEAVKNNILVIIGRQKK